MSRLNTNLTEKTSNVLVSSETKIGTLNGIDLYQKIYISNSVNLTSDTTIDNTLTTSNVEMVEMNGCFLAGDYYPFIRHAGSDFVYPRLLNNGLVLKIAGNTVTKYALTIKYLKIS